MKICVDKNCREILGKLRTTLRSREMFLVKFVKDYFWEIDGESLWTTEIFGGIILDKFSEKQFFGKLSADTRSVNSRNILAV